MRLQVINQMADRCVSLFKELAKQPTPVGAFCKRGSDGRLEVVGRWEQRDLTRMEKIRFQKSYILDITEPKLNLLASTTPVELGKEQLYAHSLDGRWLAILRSVSNNQGTDKQYLEIWDGNSKWKSIDLLAQEKHLNVIFDDFFGCLQWSPCGKKILYSAERYFKAESFFKPKTPSQEDSKNVSAPLKGEEYVFRENWGEVLYRSHSPSIYILNVTTEEITEVANIDDSISCGQGIWEPNSNGIVFVGFPHDPFRLGLIFCNNRRSAIYHADLDNGSCKGITTSDYAVGNPRFSLDGNTLVYLQSKSSGPHFNTQTLMKCEWLSKRISTVTDVPSVNDSSEFPGLYTKSLVPNRIWSCDNNSVILDTVWRSRQELIHVELSSGTVTRLTNDAAVGNWILFDVCNDYIVASRSSPSSPPDLVIGKFTSKMKTVEPMLWLTLDAPKFTEAHDLDWKIFSLNPPLTNKEYPNLDYEAILVAAGTSDGRARPLIVFPHGGPHSVSTASYLTSVEYFCHHGFAVLMVNYRGSIGFGQDCIDSLIGNIGSQDVNDIMFAIENAVELGGLDRNRMILYGGSHGGFLVLTLAGLFPDLFKACIARNPVVDVGGMVGVTDIPDWTFVESGLDYSMKSLGDPEILKAMWDRSPIRLVDKIKIPVMFTLGQVDLRVPHFQGLLMYKALKARGVETRVHLYDDNHSLSKITSESDGLVNCAKWMLKYTE